MTNTRHSIVGHADERGSALIGVLLLLMMMSALAAALGVSGRTETFIARNQRSGAQAQAAAEAGLNHAVELATTYISEWQANGLDDLDQAIGYLLVGPDLASGTAATDADNGSLDERVGIDEAEAIPLFLAPPRMTIADGVDAEYEAFVMDDDATAPDEDGDLLNDTNDRLIIRATGYASDGARVTLESIISPISLPAVLTNGDLKISGNPTIAGAGGSVHTNADLDISGNPEVVGNASASGDYSASGNPDIGGSATSGAAEITVPEIRASDYLSFADFILQSTGQVTLQNGTVVCDASDDGDECEDDYGWEFEGADDGWKISSNNAADGTFYVEGPVKVSGNPGTSADPVQITIIAEGSIEISGNPDFTPDTPDLMFVTDGDLKISGTLTMAPGAQGQMLVHAQAQISGNPELVGQLIVENASSDDDDDEDSDSDSDSDSDDDDDLVSETKISGNSTITYDGTINSGIYVVSSWRDVR